MKFLVKIIHSPRVLRYFLNIGFKFGANLKEKIRLLLFLIYSRIKYALGRNIKLRTNKFYLRIFGQYLELEISSDLTDIALLDSIFTNQDYKTKLPISSPQIIFDLGSNIGFAALYFKLLYPQAKVFCFEPDPENFKRLKTNTKMFPDIYIFNYAICSHKGEREFYRHSESHSCHSLIPRDKAEQKIRVKCLSLDEAMIMSQVRHIDLLKFDIEGAEEEVFTNFNNFSCIDHMIGEVHPHLINNFNEKQFLDIFKDYKILITALGKKSKGFFMEARKNELL